MNKKYLGDGVYVEQDDRWPAQLILTAKDGIRVTNTIYLEPEVYARLEEYSRCLGRG